MGVYLQHFLNQEIEQILLKIVGTIMTSKAWSFQAPMGIFLDSCPKAKETNLINKNNWP